MLSLRSASSRHKNTRNRKQQNYGEVLNAALQIGVFLGYLLFLSASQLRVHIVCGPFHTDVPVLFGFVWSFLNSFTHFAAMCSAVGLCNLQKDYFYLFVLGVPNPLWEMLFDSCLAEGCWQYQSWDLGLDAEFRFWAFESSRFWDRRTEAVLHQHCCSSDGSQSHGLNELSEHLWTFLDISRTFHKSGP